MKKEPAVIVMILVWLINRALDLAGIPLPADPALIDAVAEFILYVVAGAWAIRRSVFSRQTMRDAGLVPDHVEARAERARAERKAA